MTPPTTLPVIVNAIPATLQHERRWVLWRYELRDGRWIKLPLQVTGRPAKANDPSTWWPFSDAVAAYRSGRVSGIGFCLGDGWAGLDLDDCRNPTTEAVLSPARQIIDTLSGAYLEVSPSGTGFKALGRADRMGAEVRYAEGGKVVAWQGARFFALTGVGSGDPTVDLTPVIAAITAAACTVDASRPSWLPNTTRGLEHVSKGYDHAAYLDDDALLLRAVAASNGPRFLRLWRGEFSEYASQSEADLALCCLLAYWTNGNRERVDHLFRQSALYRPKWDSPSYRRSTLDKALR